MIELAPIALFCYKRIDHLKRTIKALQENDLANQSKLIIYSDSWKTDIDRPQVTEVRSYLNTIAGFKSIDIIYREKNYGLKNSIISGVTEVLKRHDSVIVLEDDIETGKHFLSYMNDGLKRYSGDLKVWQISGWAYPVFKFVNPSAYFHRKMNCWGWATWRNRWVNFVNTSNSVDVIFLDSAERRAFNLMDFEISYQVAIGNYLKRKKTWAVLWHLLIFKNNGLCLCPALSLTRNIGMDNSGTNSANFNFPQSACSSQPVVDFPEIIDENKAINKLIIEHLKSNQLGSTRVKLKKIYFKLEYGVFFVLFFYIKSIKKKKLNVILFDA